jgi:putative transposase
VEAGPARILSATVKLDGGRWFVSFICQVERGGRRVARPGGVVGVDVGIRHLAVLSTGDVIANPRHLSGASRRLGRLARAVSRKVGPDRRTRRRASKRWERARHAVTRAHARVADLRRDGLHNVLESLFDLWRGESQAGRLHWRIYSMPVTCGDAGSSLAL